MSANTFNAIDLTAALGKPGEPAPDYDIFVAELRRAVSKVMNERSQWYRMVRRSRGFANQYRTLLAIILSLGVLSTGTAAVLRFISLEVAGTGAWDMGFSVAAVLLYALAAALVFFERTTDINGGYFRSITASLAIRDLWSVWAFSEAELLSESRPAEGDLVAFGALRLRWLNTAEAFITGIDAATRQETTDWRDAAKAGLAEFGTTSTAGLTAAQQAFEARRQEIVKGRAETATAAAPATLNVEVTGALVGKTEVLCGGKAPNRTAGRYFLFDNLAQGQHLISVAIEADPKANPPSTAKSAVRAVSLKGGVNDLILEPS